MNDVISELFCLHISVMADNIAQPDKVVNILVICKTKLFINFSKKSEIYLSTANFLLGDMYLEDEGSGKGH